MSETIQNTKSLEEQQKDFQTAKITVSKNAVKRLKAVMTSDGKADHFLRMSVEGGGCSGMTYKMDFENEKAEFDKQFESNGLTIVCDLKSWLYLKDIEVDFSDDLLNGGFKIKNPNAERTCGCGTSFSA
ncbi:MAG: iron-sulfur cluster assembly accessory protein [Candidatus Marinimicrobia bacterium]|jgi:iron-sulfur cluster assembly protein|nr:iron-sulfur cluster assembly accessory protein [Candidatus Neomarinimicrobiota bacterium]MBT3946195.1 iron-sulfur cluster assembly accessory protein [Candidatus Neomarinimicrobiota bacterium]MBT4154804.1 iron-sulfur cluster assembly accessory protein [Candidatus Neomarinimicrobiota bacterium]MBT4554311.1 iron-sulfur cluster assembly accessory protein [Candidatus Neomarinimicrobiota bacterium]MBT4753863.1 iron-sulfur cluster assembly accessory protein [Candidatus Neomarinimicrobiota bacterium|tara:strand:- start:6462 stop:6848 length:387 start_codon:yes stop_codon:yes gene_type:complete